MTYRSGQKSIAYYRSHCKSALRAASVFVAAAVGGGTVGLFELTGEYVPAAKAIFLAGIAGLGYSLIWREQLKAQAAADGHTIEDILKDSA